jgi:NADPH:quinone reductase-like Zn-dependent oxidoreductase
MSEISTTAASNRSTTTMRAMVQRGYGPPDLLGLENLEVPAVPKDHVLVRVHAAAVNPGDVFSLTGRPYVVRLVTGLVKPRNPVPGLAFSGTVESVSRGVSRFRPGDAVYGETSRGAYAEYVSVREGLLAMKPDNATFEQAAAVPLSGVTALQGLRDKGRVAPGSKVLINGASGGVGTFAVQIGRSLGAEVTAVCSTRNVEMLRSLGAHHVIDYTREDFTRTRERYDVVFDLIGNHSLSDLRRILTTTGTLVLSSGPPSPTLRRILMALLWTPFVSQLLVPLLQNPNGEDLDYLTDLIESGEVTSVLDRIFPLDEAPEALRYQGEGHARGRTIIAV